MTSIRNTLHCNNKYYSWKNNYKDKCNYKPTHKKLCDLLKISKMSNGSKKI